MASPSRACAPGERGGGGCRVVRAEVLERRPDVGHRPRACEPGPAMGKLALASLDTQGFHRTHHAVMVGHSAQSTRGPSHIDLLVITMHDAV